MKAKIYTKTGDRGESSLADGTRVRKTHVRLEAYGTLDELSSVLGLVRANLATSDPRLGRLHIDAKIQAVQNGLFNMGSRLACANPDWLNKMPNITETDIGLLETDMDTWENELPALKNFILPGGHPVAAFAHLGRTVCRRAERALLSLGEAGETLDPSHIIFINRLSDWLFLLARQINRSVSVSDPEWTK